MKISRSLFRLTPASPTTRVFATLLLVVGAGMVTAHRSSVPHAPRGPCFGQQPPRNHARHIRSRHRVTRRSEGGDGWLPFFLPDGRCFFFNRRRNRVTEEQTDIYWVDFRAIFRPTFCIRPARRTSAAALSRRSRRAVAAYNTCPLLTDIL